MTVYCNRVSGCVRRGGTWVFGGGGRGGASCSCRVNGGVSEEDGDHGYLTAKQVTADHRQTLWCPEREAIHPRGIPDWCSQLASLSADCYLRLLHAPTSDHTSAYQMTSAWERMLHLMYSCSCWFCVYYEYWYCNYESLFHVNYLLYTYHLNLKFLLLLSYL